MKIDDLEFRVSIYDGNDSGSELRQRDIVLGY
jgi:hypothetical protein